MKKRNECQCDKCKTACRTTPGWFLPGEAEALADYMGMPLKQVFDEYLAVNWFVGPPMVFALAPALVEYDAGEEYPADPRGTCVFLSDEDLCKIHPVKPHECAVQSCKTYDKNLHEAVAKAWIPHQKQIVELLGREPVEQEFTIFDALSNYVPPGWTLRNMPVSLQKPGGREIRVPFEYGEKE